MVKSLGDGGARKSWAGRRFGIRPPRARGLLSFGAAHAMAAPRRLNEEEGHQEGDGAGKKTKLRDLAPKTDPKAGLNFAADGSVMPQIGNTGNIPLPAVQNIYNKK